MAADRRRAVPGAADPVPGRQVLTLSCSIVTPDGWRTLPTLSSSVYIERAAVVA